MINYLQKIASRSGESAVSDNNPAQYILPDKPSFFPESQDVSKTEESFQTGSANDSPDSISDKTSHLTEPQTETEMKTNDVSEMPKEMKKNLPSRADQENKKLQPPITILEKITQRNFRNSIVNEESVKNKLTPRTKENSRFSDSIVLRKDSKPEKEESKKVKGMRDENILAVTEQLHPDPPAQKIKEILVPVEKDNLFVTPNKNTGQNNKLVIGRITVEVMNQVQPTSKTQEPVKRQSNASKTSSPEFTSNNKLSFGLGQL